MNIRHPTSHTRHPPLWRNISFTLMWTSTAASGFGDRMIMLAALALLGGMVSGVDSTATQASTQFWFFLPYIVFSVSGGWLADHLPRKWLLLACDESRGVILLIAALMVAQMTGSAQVPTDMPWFTLPGVGFDVPQTWKVYGALFAIGTFAAIFNPTRNAIIPQIIPNPQLTTGNAVILVINVVAGQIGLLLGKQLISQTDAHTVHTCLLLGAGFYIVSGTFFAFLRPIDAGPRAAADTDTQRSFIQAAKYVSRHRRIIALIFLGVLIWPSAAIVTSGLFGLGKVHYGLKDDALLAFFANLSVTLGVGMLIGAVIVSVIRTRRELALVYLTALVVAGLGVLLLVSVPVLAAAYAACALIGIAGNVAIVGVLSVLQSVSPNYVRGRVMGINSLLNTIFSVATYGMIWRLEDADRTIIPVMYGLGAVLIMIGLVGLVRVLRSGPMPTGAGNFFWRVNRLFMLVWHRVQWIGRENVPHDGAVILASNHTCAIDPMLIQAGCNRVVHWLMLTHFMFPVLKPLWNAVQPIALDRDASDMTKLRRVIRTLQQGEMVGIFPEGGLQRDHRDLRPFQPGLSMIARRSNAMIVPIWIDGTPRKYHIRSHFLTPSHSRVVFGKAYRVDPDMKDQQVMDDLRARILALAEQS